MPELSSNLAPEEQIILAIDTSTMGRAEELVTIASQAGAWVVKMGLELMTAVGPQACAELAEDYNLEWVADAKLFDIPNTVKGAVCNYTKLKHPPVGITIATKSGIKSLEIAQDIADEAGAMMLGVTHLTSNDATETMIYEKVKPSTVVWRESRRAVAAGINGLVCSGQEVGQVKKYKATRNLFTMIPGTRSAGADVHDQKRSITPAEAVSKGANLLVIGREVTDSKNPASEYERIISSITEARSAKVSPRRT